MLEGDLATTPLADVLRGLADAAATGGLRVVAPARAEPGRAEPVRQEGTVYLRDGEVYAVASTGDLPAVGARLLSSGAVAPDALVEALQVQAEELPGWRLGELLVHLGHVEPPVVEAAVRDRVQAQLSDLLEWPQGSWRFRAGLRTRTDLSPPVAVSVLLAEHERRRATAHGADDPSTHAGAALEPEPDPEPDDDAGEHLAEVVDLQARRDDDARRAGQAELDRLAAEQDAHRGEPDAPLLHADLLAELSAALAEPAPSDLPVTPLPPAEPDLHLEPDLHVEPDLHPELDPDEVAETPAQQEAQATDTAALMRELSSLGLDDEPAAPAPARAVGAAPRSPQAQARKRKGLFGR